MTFHILKMCTFCYVHVHHYILMLTGVELRHFYAPYELWDTYSNRTVRLSVRPSVYPALCPVHISNILRGRNPKFWCVCASWNGGVSRTIFGSL